MNTYECLQDEACGDGIDVIDYTFHSDRIKGLYCDGTVDIRSCYLTNDRNNLLLLETLRLNRTK